MVAFFASPKWGESLDKWGIHHVMMRAGIVSSVIPLFMLFSTPGSMWTYLLFSLFHGATLTAVYTTAQKMLTSAMPENNRTMYIALYYVSTAIAAGIGYLMGGALLELLGEVNFSFAFIHWDRYKILFSFAGILRLVILILFLPLMTKLLDEPKL